MSLNVLAFESRRGSEMATLLRNLGWNPTIVPVFVETPQDDPAEAIQFGADLLAGNYEQVILLTGVAVRHLWKTLQPHYSTADLTAALQKTVTIPRGPKPAAALREIGVTPTLLIRQPATWREILASLADRPPLNTAVIEYGRRDARLLAGLDDLNIPHRSVAVYHYDFPSDLGPVREVLARLAAREFHVVIFTASVQYLFLAAAADIADDAWKQGLQQSYVASIGPTMTETLEADSIPVHFQPSSSKMGILIHELARQNISKT